MKVAGQFGIPVEDTTSREQLARTIEESFLGDALHCSHFSKQSVDEQDVQLQFYKKVQSVPSLHFHSLLAVSWETLVCSSKVVQRVTEAQIKKTKEGDHPFAYLDHIVSATCRE